MCWVNLWQERSFPGSKTKTTIVSLNHCRLTSDLKLCWKHETPMIRSCGQNTGCLGIKTHEVRIARCNNYKNLFDEVKDTNSIKNAIEAYISSHINNTRKEDKFLAISDFKKADLLNDHFFTIGGQISHEWPPLYHDGAPIRPALSHPQFRVLASPQKTLLMP